MSRIWDGLVDTGRDLLGGIQGTIAGGDSGTTWRLDFGEKRVVSWATLAAVLVIGFLLGRAA
jgi:hypothetical protein